jgi:predicted ester cyclase
MKGICGAPKFKVRQYLPFLAAFPDLRLEVEAAVAEGDQVVVRWSARGTNSGDGLGFRPTRRAVTFRGITWIKVRDGKLHEGWQSSNIPEVVRGLAASATG